uniref:Uncharacterized protein n=1 Tax=Timema poppense TaxID=170557 RepID=A0A7R9DBK6_TIMPO|nr:unnamed protein product [Timema poppensis]
MVLMSKTGLLAGVRKPLNRPSRLLLICRVSPLCSTTPLPSTSRKDMKIPSWHQNTLSPDPNCPQGNSYLFARCCPYFRLLGTSDLLHPVLTFFTLFASRFLLLKQTML